MRNASNKTEARHIKITSFPLSKEGGTSSGWGVGFQGIKEILKDIYEKMLSRKKNYQFDDIFTLNFDLKVFRKSVVGAVSYVFRSRHKT